MNPDTINGYSKYGPDACPHCGDEVCAHPQDDPAWKEYRCGTVYGYYPSDLCHEREKSQKLEAEVERLTKELAAWDYGTRAKREQDARKKAEAEVERLKGEWQATEEALQQMTRDAINARL